MDIKKTQDYQIKIPKKQIKINLGGLYESNWNN